MINETRIFIYKGPYSIVLMVMKYVPCLLIFFITIALQFGATVRAQTAISGIPVPELSLFDDAMISVMEDYDMQAGVLAISKDGCVVYQRGFGSDAESIDLVAIPENMPMRLASVEKPLTAAVIRDIIANDFLLLNLNDFVFDLGQSGGGGILPAETYYPYNGHLGDARLANITVSNLLLHQGGWDISVLGYDPQYSCIMIADAMNISSPPGRINTVRYMMSQPLQYMPGTQPCNRDSVDNCQLMPPGCYCGFQYSNFGYMLLGLIIEEVTGENVAAQVRRRILTPDMWIPATEVFTGRTFYEDTDPREPYYIHSGMWSNVFDPTGDLVPAPYGGWDQWALQGHGNLVSSAVPLLKFLDNYVVSGNNIGIPLITALTDTNWSAHGGGMAGTSTVALQHGGNINIVVLFNERNDDALGALVDMLLDLIDGWGYPQNWPTFCVDGFWLDFNATVSGFGGYDGPFHTMETALASTADGTKLRIKPGTSNWTGKISKKMLIDAPFGTVIIGK